ncbi:hypothetical protein PG999_005122 [Apiospora kogelbergensis]|uniref:Ecp2 effector protein-like domain-containing protein n=1 Tax=Apiospora kogelbergensis TaxID=1337665 RepID=A0AAW0R176_9PEZI
MTLYMMILFVWGLAVSAAHLGGGIRMARRNDGVEFHGEWRPNGKEIYLGQNPIQGSMRYSKYEAGETVTKCNDPIFNHAGRPPNEPQARWADCHSIIKEMNESWNGHGYWRLADPPSLDPLASSGSCSVGIHQQAGSTAKLVEFGNEDLAKIILGKEGTTFTLARYRTGSIKCGDAMMDFTMHG